MKRQAETQRHAIPTYNLSKIEEWADREIDRIVLVINDKLDCETSSEFLADRDTTNDRWELLAICREWLGRVGLPPAPNPRESDAISRFRRAKEIVEGDNLWGPGKSVAVRNDVTIEYSNMVGDLFLVATTPSGKVQTRCARLPMFVDGATLEGTNGKYVWTLTADEYRQWTYETMQAL